MLKTILSSLRVIKFDCIVLRDQFKKRTLLREKDVVQEKQ